MMDPRAVAMIPGKAVDGNTGLLHEADGCWTNWEPVELGAGSAIVAPREGCRYRISCYEAIYDESLAHTYSYDAESNWTTLSSQTPPGEWLTGSFEFPQTCFVRITVQRKGEPCDNEPCELDSLVELRYVEPAVTPLADWAREEVERVCARVGDVRETGDLTLLVLSDVHYSTGCIWPETARNILEVTRRLKPDAIVQLGDVGDGIAPLAVTMSFAERVLGDLARCGVPVHSCVGNHDANYFKGNTDCLSVVDCARLYQGHDEPWYCEDFPNAHVRCIFLQSFDPTRAERYGYDGQQVRWLRKVLRETPYDYKVVVFSHLPLYAEIHYWSDTLLNERKISRILERFNRRRGGAIVAFVHGHSHVDQIYWKQSFPDVSIGCAKFEDFKECKPAGSYTPERRHGDASQDLWDVMVVKAREPLAHFIRFGAGDDREVVTYDPR